MIGWSRVAGMVFVACAVGAGCNNNDSEFDITPPATVVIVGDSIMAQSLPRVSSTLSDAGWTPVVDARPGSSISGDIILDEGWPSRVADLVEVADPDVAVVELGTNGCGNCASTRAEIDKVMQELRGVEQVYWLNVREAAPIPDRPGALNAELDAATDRWDNLTILDMNEHFAEHPEWIDDDQIHLTDRGEAALARFVVDALPDPGDG